MNPFQVVKDFEQAVAEYTGSPYAVAVNSCTNALFLCFTWAKMLVDDPVALIPSKTYISVPMQAKHAGFNVRFSERFWKGAYEIEPLGIWDSARRFTSNMYKEFPNNRGFISPLVCTSHHWSKILGVQQGGCILHGNEQFDDWARKARFDGRTEGVAPKDDRFDMLGWHMYMSPEIAAEGLVRLHHLPEHNADLPNDDYPDLSKLDIFK